MNSKQKGGLLARTLIVLIERWLELPCKEENPNYEIYMPCHNGV